MATEYINVEQGSDEWLTARAGLLTASVVKDAFAVTKSGWGASRAALKAKLICERLTGKPVPTFVNDAMMRGTELEPQARAMAELEYDATIREVGLAKRDILLDTGQADWLGASCDGVDERNHCLWEFKCPLPHTHLDYVKNPDLLVKKYTAQCTAQLWVMDMEICNLMSFCPDLPSGLDIVKVTIRPSGEDFRGLVDNARDFLTELQSDLSDLNKKRKD
jgi:hypothetical protein